MLVVSFSITLLITSFPLVVTHNSFLQQRRGQRAVGDWDETEIRLCRFGSSPGFENAIKVFADESENTRYVSFVREGYVTDDGFIESMQKCKGSLPEVCKHKDTNSTSNGCAACPCELDLEHEPFGNYQRRMLELITPRCQAAKGADNKDPFHILLVGLGGGALVQYILGQCPQGTLVDAVEYDARMIEISKRFFGLHASPSVFKVEQGDGGAVVAARADHGKTYDMVLVDAFAGGSHVPESCRNSKFVGNLRHILRKGGTVLHNMAGPTVSNLAGPDDYKTTFPIYKQRFGTESVELEVLKGNMEFPARLIVAHAGGS